MQDKALIFFPRQHQNQDPQSQNKTKTRYKFFETRLKTRHIIKYLNTDSLLIIVHLIIDM